MRIENTDAVRQWLRTYLETQSDADPVALSKYVLALLRKDKSEADLRKSLLDQMEVFLQASTSQFVDQLFAQVNKPSLKEIKKELKDPEEEHKAEKPGPPPAEPETTDNHNSSMTRDDIASMKRYAREHVDAPPERRRSPRRSSAGRRFRSRSRSPAGHSFPKRRTRSRSPNYPGRNRWSPYRGRKEYYKECPISRSYSPPLKSHRGEASPLRKEANPYVDRRPRCRDYDEKGFCMRGDQCKFDHGTDAVVLDGATTESASYSAILAGGENPYVPSVPLPPLHLPPPSFAVAPATGNSSAPAGLVSASRKRAFPAATGIKSRLGFRSNPTNNRGTASKLAVRNIPPELNNIAHLNNHFARFGTLINIEVSFEGDPASALVTFSSSSEAEQALNSSDAVLGNRFIKMHYYYNNNQPRVPIKERLGFVPFKKTSDRVNFDGVQLTKTISNTPSKAEGDKGSREEGGSEEKEVAIAAMKKNQEILETKAQLKKEAEEKRQQQLKQVADIQKSKQELIEKLINQEKKLIAMLEEKKLKSGERQSVMSMLKDLTEKIVKAKEELKEAVHIASVTTMAKRAPAQLQRELLDAELELFQAEQDGSNTSDLERRVNLLKLEAARAGLLPTSKPVRGRGRGRGRASPYRGGRSSFFRGRGMARGRGMTFATGTSLDRRPSKLLVTGIDVKDKEALLAHFSKFGEIVESTLTTNDDGLVMNYKTRREAEMALSGGRMFQNRELDIAWHNPSGSPADFSLEMNSSTNIEPEATEDDGYTPLDPTYLPAGLEDEEENALLKKKSDGAEEEETVLETTAAEENELLYNDEDDDEERSWKR